MLINLDSTNTNSLDYYIKDIFILLLIYCTILIISTIIKNKNENNLNVTLDYYGKKEGVQIVHDVLTHEQSSLRWRFLIASTAIKAATWVKAPYLFALYNRIHGFSRSEIGILYAIDNFSSLIFGPIFGSLCDLYGRKKFCLFYCIFIVSHIYLRLTGSKFLAIFAQIITGMCSCLIDTAFESWVNFEANLVFDMNTLEGKMQKNSYLREIFTKQTNLDCFCSIVLTGIATILYMNYGIFYPFYACVIFSIIAFIIIFCLWDENDNEKLARSVPVKNETDFQQTFFEKITLAWNTLMSDKALFAIGIIEGCFKVCLQLFLFIWTPLLEETAGGLVHPGAIFVCFMLARLIGSEFYDSLKQFLRANSYLICIIITGTACISFFLDYYVYNFTFRFFMFVYFDGLSGIFQPLMSSLKAQMIPEKYRTTIMNFFRMPINVLSIFILIFTRYFTTYQICLFAFVFMIIAVIVNFYLFLIHHPPDKERHLEKTSTLPYHAVKQSTDN